MHMTIEAKKGKSEGPIIKVSLKEIQDQAKKELGRYLTRDEIDSAVLQRFAISQLISLTVELSAIEPAPD